MFKVAQSIFKAIEVSSVQCEGANIFISDGEVAGQEVLHSHLHIVPRFEEDGQNMRFNHTLESRKNLDLTAREIKYYLE